MICLGTWTMELNLQPQNSCLHTGLNVGIVLGPEPKADSSGPTDG